MVGSNIFLQSDSIYFLQKFQKLFSRRFSISSNQLHFMLKHNFFHARVITTIIPGGKHFINFLLAPRQWGAQPLLAAGFHFSSLFFIIFNIWMNSLFFLFFHFLLLFHHFHHQDEQSTFSYFSIFPHLHHLESGSSFFFHNTNPSWWVPWIYFFWRWVPS